MDNSEILEIEYQAMEVNRDIIRLGRDFKGRVYVISKHSNSFSAPYQVALGGFLYRFNKKLETYEMNDEEMTWLKRMNNFARELSLTKDIDILE